MEESVPVPRALVPLEGGDRAETDLALGLVRTLPGVVYRCAHDADWTMLLISDEVAVITGYAASDFIGNRRRSFASVIHPGDRDRVALEVDSQLAEQDDFSCEYRILHADGTTAWILERGRRVRPARATGPLIDGILFDVTERRRLQEQLRETLAEQSVTQALVAERTNVVHELHDSVGHALRVLSLFGKIAGTQLPADPAAAEATVGVMQEVVEDSLGDIDRLLAAIGDRVDGAHGKGLSDLPPLIDRVRSAGLSISVLHVGEPEGCPEQVGHVAYRLVQESLTNVMKHAAGAAVTIRVQHDSAGIDLAVTNGGPVCGPPPAGRDVRTGRRGISGLRDRVEQLGGEFTAGPRPQGGFAVTARIPHAA